MKTIIKKFDQPGAKPRGDPSPEEMIRLDKVTILVQEAVESAYTDLISGKFHNFVGPWFDVLRSYGEKIKKGEGEPSHMPVDEENEKEKEKEKEEEEEEEEERDEQPMDLGEIEVSITQHDPRRVLGYTIEERSYSLLKTEQGDKIGEWQAQYSRVLPTYTRPDIVIFLVDGREGLIDITATDSENHVLAKGGGNWFKNEKIVWVCEVLYPSFELNTAKMIAVGAWGGVDEGTYAALRGKMQDAYKMLAKKRKEIAEAEFSQWLDDKEEYCREHGFYNTNTKQVAPIHKFRARQRLLDLGVDDQRVARRKRKSIPETRKRTRRLETNKIALRRMRRKRADPGYVAAERARAAERQKKRKRKESESYHEAMALSRTRKRRKTSRYGKFS